MHVWVNNSVIKQLKVHSVNVTPLEAEFMAICTGLIPAMEIDNIHNITVITDSIVAARKILEFKVDPLQNIFIPLASVAKTFLNKDGKNKFTSGTALAKLNGLDINLLMIKSKQTHVTLHPPARSHIYSVKRKSATTFSANSKCPLPTALKKAITF